MTFVPQSGLLSHSGHNLDLAGSHTLGFLGLYYGQTDSLCSAQGLRLKSFLPPRASPQSLRQCHAGSSLCYSGHHPSDWLQTALRLS